MYKIVALFGKAGSGKDTLLNGFCNKYGDDFHKIISCTTRPPRDYEKDGVDYYFLSNIGFLEKVANGDMLEATEFREWFYGTSLSSLKEDKINIGVFNPEGILNLVESIGDVKDFSILPIMIYADDKTRLIRQLNREKNPDCAEICRRFSTDEIDFEKFLDEADFYIDVMRNEDTCDLTPKYDILAKLIKKL